MMAIFVLLLLIAWRSSSGEADETGVSVRARSASSGSACVPCPARPSHKPFSCRSRVARAGRAARRCAACRRWHPDAARAVVRVSITKVRISRAVRCSRQGAVRIARLHAERHFRPLDLRLAPGAGLPLALLPRSRPRSTHRRAQRRGLQQLRVSSCALHELSYGFPSCAVCRPRSRRPARPISACAVPGRSCR